MANVPGPPASWSSANHDFNQPARLSPLRRPLLRVKRVGPAVSAFRLHPRLRTYRCEARTDASGHVWTAPAVQEESDVLRAFGCSHVCGLFSCEGLPPSRCGHCGRWP